MKLWIALVGLVVALVGCKSGGGIDTRDPDPCDLPCVGDYECRRGDVFVQEGEPQSGGTPCPGGDCAGEDGVEEYVCCDVPTVRMFEDVGGANPWANGCRVNLDWRLCETDADCESFETCREDPNLGEMFCRPRP